MDEEERFACPKCGVFVSKSDPHCSNCGVSLIGVSSPSVSETGIEVPYERNFSVIQRLVKVLVAPREAMRDIAFAPEYGGPVLILVLNAVLAIFGLVVVFQKFSFVGGYAGAVMFFVMVGLVFGSIIGIVLMFVRWLVKGWVVEHVCDSGSGWDFKTAAAVTGYAYFPGLILGVISLVVSWYLIPSFTFDMTDLQAALVAVSEYQVQLNWLMLVYTLPISLITLVWKSYLGGLGVHSGTRENCSLGLGVAVFFVLGLISVLISFVGFLL